MKKLKHIVLAGVGVIVLILVILYALFAPRSIVHAPVANAPTASQTEQIFTVDTPQPATTSAPLNTTFIGPRENIPKDAPSQYGFWSFAVPVTGQLSRSGQPLISEFQWLKQNGWNGDVDLRMDGEYNDPTADDSKLPGFNALGFHYLHLNILDG
ncbi:MAG TPA: hypothetical protein VLG69_01375, partial [Candidatus Andersenbacteria bacterium]|nr:hypothetical protein [Candidatus Andersenbacteria bacterium]